MTDLREVAPLGFTIVRVAKMHRRWVSEDLAHLGLHVGQELVLLNLCEQEGIRQTDLAVALDIEVPTVHKTLARLEAAGFVERRPDPDDGRASLAFLTRRGREACAAILEIWQNAERRLSAAVSGRDTQVLDRLLKGLHSAT